MAKYKIVHYINQFFAGIGGEEKADYTPELREGVVGPGMGLKAALGEDYEIVSTIICGDNYFGENLDAATVWASRLSPVCISRILAWICSARTLSLWIHLTPQPVCQRYFLLCPL